MAGVTSVSAKAELASRVSRIITPALAQGSVFPRPVSSATIEPSPVRVWYTKLKPSAVLQMSAPASPAHDGRSNTSTARHRNKPAFPSATRWQSRQDTPELAFDSRKEPEITNLGWRQGSSESAPSRIK